VWLITSPMRSVFHAAQAVRSVRREITWWVHHQLSAESVAFGRTFGASAKQLNVQHGMACQRLIIKECKE
jgi:hypothetical protein